MAPRKGSSLGPQYIYCREASDYLREEAAKGTPYKVMALEVEKRWPGKRPITEDSVSNRLRRMGVKKAKRKTNWS